MSTADRGCPGQCNEGLAIVGCAACVSEVAIKGSHRQRLGVSIIKIRGRGNASDLERTGKLRSAESI